MATRSTPAGRILAALSLLPLVAVCGGDPEPCTSCLDVGGRFSTVRTISHASNCPAPPAGGDVHLVIVQNGSSLRFDYEGDELRGTLFSDRTAKASNTEKPDRQNLFKVSRELEATFSEDGGKVKLQATLRERQTPVTPQVNDGKICEFTATLQGLR